MRIVILSQDSLVYSTRRLLEAAGARGHDAVVVDYQRLGLLFGSDGGVANDEGLLADAAVVIPRFGIFHTEFGVAALRTLESPRPGKPGGTPSTCSPDGLRVARDKLATAQALASAGIPTPATGLCQRGIDADAILAATGGPPWVVKLRSATHGAGVLLCESEAAVRSVVDAFAGFHKQVVVQAFVRTAMGRDRRLVVIDGEVVCAIERRAAPGEFRANLKRGGTAHRHESTEQERGLAIRAAAAVGLEIAGVDLIEGPDGPLCLEVNASPGLRGAETASGVDVATPMVRFAERCAARG